MTKRLTCFVIAPLGTPGSNIRQDSDDLLDLIIKPSLEIFNIDVIRGDHRNESGQIDVDVVKLVQESDLCIADLSYENVNVYYEMGRRDETGKPILLLKSSSSKNLPVDIATRRYIEFNLDDRRAIVTARDKIKDAIQCLIDAGLEKSKGTSLYDISEKIDRIDRNIVRLIESKQNFKITNSEVQENWQNEDPIVLFKLALVQKNILMAEYAMDKLFYRMEFHAFLDIVVEQVSLIGSRKAGELLIENIQIFMDAEDSTQKKAEYLMSLIAYLNTTNQENSYLDIIEKYAKEICKVDDTLDSYLNNQLNKLYYGAYINTEEPNLLEKALYYLTKAIEKEPENSSYYYNLATCYVQKAKSAQDNNEEIIILEEACECIDKAIQLAGNNYDEDHIILACKLYHRMNDPRFSDCIELLRSVSPNRAILLQQELK